MVETMRLWVDDERPAPLGFTHWAKTSQEAIAALRLMNLTVQVDEVSLDHDLGGDDTGMKVLQHFIDYDNWPDTLTIHTANPPARKRMLAAANAEAPSWVEIYVQTKH